MYTSQVNAAPANTTTNTGKTAVKSDKADKSFADVLSQKTETPDTAANQSQQTKNEQTSDKTTTDQQTSSQDTKTDETTANQTNTTDGEASEPVTMETELAPEMMFLLNIPSPTQTVETVQEETMVSPMMTKEQENGLTAQETMTQTVIKPDENKQQQPNTPIMQNNGQQPVEKNDLPKIEMPTIVASEQTVQTTEEAAPTVQAEVAVADTTEETATPTQTTQNIAAPQNTEGFRQESIEVKIPVSDSSSILQRQTTQQVTNQIISQFKDGVQQFTLNLHPEHLGRVVVNMAFEHGMLHLRVETHSQLAQNLLVGGLADLKNTLNENGIQVSDVDISPFAEQRQSEQQHDAQHSHFGGGQNAHHGNFEEEVDEEAEDDALLTEGLLDYSI